jgi:DNA-binding transcriptional regulator YhcF (GntR family)
MTVMADVYAFIEDKNLKEFNADMLAEGTGHKVNTVATTLSILKRAGRLEKGSKSGFYTPVKEEEMTEEERLAFQQKAEQQRQEMLQRRLEKARENTTPVQSVHHNSIVIAVDDNVEVNMKREGGKTIYSFVLK